MLSAERQVALDEALHRLQGMAAAVPVDARWDAPDAAELDTTTFDAWLRANIGDPEGPDLVGIVAEVQATPAAELSLLWALYSIVASNGFDDMVSVTDGAQQDRFVGGSQLVSIKAAERLGEAIVLDAPVRSILTTSTGVTVRSDRSDVHARRVIVAVPPVLAAGLCSSRPCPPTRTTTSTRTLPGSVIKGTWSTTSPSGVRTGSPASGRIIATADVRVGQLTAGWMAGRARGLLRSHLRQEVREGVSRGTSAYRDRLARRCLRARAKDPNEFLELDWSTEPWTRGCYAGKPAVGAAVAFGRALRRADGPVHWASAETATKWHGYFDGAVSSGHRAAREVLEALG